MEVLTFSFECTNFLKRTSEKKNHRAPPDENRDLVSAISKMNFCPKRPQKGAL